MTKKERLIVSAYTGILMVDWDELIDFAEERLGRPILAKETDTEEFAMQLMSAVEDDFMELCEDEDVEDTAY